MSSPLSPTTLPLLSYTTTSRCLHRYHQLHYYLLSSVASPLSATPLSSIATVITTVSATDVYSTSLSITVNYTTAITTINYTPLSSVITPLSATPLHYQLHHYTTIYYTTAPLSLPLSPLRLHHYLPAIPKYSYTTILNYTIHVIISYTTIFSSFPVISYHCQLSPLSAITTVNYTIPLSTPLSPIRLPLSPLSSETTGPTPSIRLIYFRNVF